MFEYIEPDILPVGCFLFICSTVGIFGNTLIILCTVKSKKFRSPCHILIALICLADIFHLSGQYPFCIHLFGNLTSTQYQCYFMMILPIIGFTITGPLMLSMGIDRFIAIKMPLTYRYYTDHKKCYLFAQLMLPILYSLFFIVYGSMGIDSNPENQIKCAIPLSMNGHAFRTYTHSNGVILLIVLIVYLKVSVILKMSSATAQFRVVFRSIAVTVIFQLFGWMATMVASVVIHALLMEPKLFNLISMYCGIPVNLAVASNLLIFYMINSEYRLAIKSILFRQKNKVQSSSNTGIYSFNKLSREQY